VFHFTYIVACQNFILIAYYYFSYVMNCDGCTTYTSIYICRYKNTL